MCLHIIAQFLNLKILFLYGACDSFIVGIGLDYGKDVGIYRCGIKYSISGEIYQK